MNESEYVWLGATGMDQGGMWEWTDGTTLSSTFKFWAPGRPQNNTKRRWIVAKPSGWEDVGANWPTDSQPAGVLCMMEGKRTDY